jgi:hypothetical protein
MIAVNQYGRVIHVVHPRKDLESILGGKAHKIYVDGKDGKTYHIGYVIRNEWYSLYTDVRKVETKGQHKRDPNWSISGIGEVIEKLLF